MQMNSMERSMIRASYELSELRLHRMYENLSFPLVFQDAKLRVKSQIESKLKVHMNIKTCLNKKNIRLKQANKESSIYYTYE